MWKGSQRPDISINSPSGHQEGVKEAVNSEANTFRPLLAVTWMNLSQQSPAEVPRKYLPASCCKIRVYFFVALHGNGGMKQQDGRKVGKGWEENQQKRKVQLYLMRANQTRKCLAMFRIIQTLSQTLITGTGNCRPGRREVDCVCALHLLPAEMGMFQARCCWALLLSSSKISLIKGLIIPTLEAPILVVTIRL